jgi:hypothetical protein
LTFFVNTKDKKSGDKQIVLRIYDDQFTLHKSNLLIIKFFKTQNRCSKKLNNHPLTTQVVTIYMAKKATCHTHNHLEENPRWTTCQKPYLKWETFSIFSTSSLMLSLGLRPATHDPAQLVVCKGKGKVT